MKKNLLLFVLFLLVFRALSPTYACDNTPLLVVYDPVEIAGGQWNLEVFVCFGSEESEDGFTLESTGGVVDIMNSTPNQLENPYNGNIADAIFSGGVLNYYYDNSDGSNYNDADGETGPCVDFQITVDADPIGTSFTMAGVNDGCAYTISDDQLTSEVTFTPPCSATQSMIAPGTITGSTENAPTNCNFRVPVFSTVKDNIIEVEIPCDGEYTFSTCGSSFNTWMAISYQCCFLPFASNDNSCGEQSEITVDLLAGTYYVLVEGFLWDDEGDYILNVTSSTEAVSINNIDLTEPQCSMNDAELVIHAIGDDPPFSFSIDGGSSFSSDSVFSNLSGGNYFVVVESQSGCIASTLFSINTNPPLILDSIQTTIAACNSSMGELSIFVSNGSSPYQYSIDNGSSFQSSNVFSSLAAGNYLISVVDANGCEVNSSFDLSGSSTPIIESLIINDASCGLATGQVQINASGIGTLSYSIDGISYQSSNVFNGLSSGIYGNISVQNASGCIADTSLVIGDSGSPTFDQITISASACDTSGSIEIIASGGAGPYMYSIDGGLNYFSSNTFSNLNSGLYTVNLLDDNLCTIDSIVSIGQLSSLSFDNIIITEPSCDPSTGIISANGSIEITASGGASTLNYSIDGGGNFQLSNTFNSLTFGAYQVVVNDGSCSIDSLISLSTNPGPEIDILDARDLTCGEENGFIAVKVLNPTNPDYIYEFDNGIESIQSAPTPDDQYSYDQLSAGIWNIIVSDGDGCIADTVVELSISPDISITDVLIDSVFCNQTNGAFTVLATSGNLPIEYSLMSDFSSSQGNGYFNGLSAGSYTVYLRDDRLCLDTITVNLSNVNGVVIDSLQSVDPTCEDHNGEITIHVSEGTPPYFYSVDNGLNFQSGNYFSGLHDEDYEILVVDASGCVASSSITLVEIGGITLESMIIPLHCDSTNGEIILTATGGDNNYTFTIDNGLSQSNTSGLFTDLPGGFYDVNVVDGQGCSDYATLFLDSLASPQIDSVLSTDESCGAMNGSISIFVSEGAGPYTYSIDNGLSFSNSSTFSGLSAGSYQIVIQDSLLCADSTLASILLASDIAIDTLLLENPSCGDSTGSVIVFLENATPPVQYILAGVDSNSTGTFVNLGAGNYTLTIIDALDCSLDSSFTLTDLLSADPPAQTMADFYSCYTNLMISANDPLGNSGQWSIISGNAALASTTDNTTLATGLSLGSNQFVWTISYTDCPSTSDTLSIEVIEEIIVDAGEDIYNAAPVPVLLNATADIPGDFSWIPPNDLTDPSIPNPVATVSSSTLFIVTVSNNYGCVGQDSVWIYIAQDINFPTAFTPNNDGNNDTWIIQNIEFFPDAEVSIMNRYGNSVFESKGYTMPWDGTYKGNEVPVGSYFFIIDLGDDFGVRTGSISVIR